jgi:tryptophan halogenase
MSELIRSVVIVGGGSAAWIAAAGLARAFRARPLDVRVVEAATTGSTSVGWWTLPSQRGIHGLLGISEPHFLQRTGATFRLGTEHHGWQGDGSAFLHAHGDIGIDLDGTPFYKYLIREARAGRAANPHAFSLAGSAARLGRFARPMGSDLTASFTYGFHVAELRYANYLRDHAQRVGVQVAAAPLADVTLTGDGRIESLHLADGSRETADLFIDCTGSEAKLISRVSADGREDWSAWLPCDRMIMAASAASESVAPVTRTQAAKAGWLWQAPLSGSVMAGHVYSGAFLDDSAARAALEQFQPGLSGEPVISRLRAGRRRHSWVGNCVALGSAAMELEPLAGAELHFAQLGLATLVELFPLRRTSTIEAREFNRLIAEHADALRDFTLAHYRAGAARPGEFWTAVRSVAAPATLADRLDLFAASGRLVMRDHETFEETDWAWLLIGSGCIPASLEIQVRDRLDRVPPGDIEAIRTRVQQLAGSMPTHDEFLRHQVASAARAG